MTFHAERMIYMSKKMINETTDVVFNPETGKYEVERTHQFATLSTEDKFFKFYYEGLVYMSDMPLEYHRVLYALLDNMSYVDQKVEGLGDYGMHIFLNADIKRAIAKSLGLKNYRCIDNAIQMLLKGEVLIRVGKGIFRPNPNIIARGAWIKPRSPALEAESLPAEPRGKLKNIGVGSLSLLQQIFLTQELIRGGSFAGRFFT